MIEKPIIIALVGESGSGKTTLSFMLQDKLDIPAIVSYTTRPMRESEIDGVDHYFVPITELPELESMFAHTIYGDNHYWTMPSQFDKASIMTYVVDEAGLIFLNDNWGHKYNVISTLIKRPENPTDKVRKDRDKGRTLISEEKYDVVLVNNGTLSDFYRHAILKLGEATSQNWK